MPKAIPYVRFSSKKQEKGGSKERQNALVAAWLERNKEFSISSLVYEDLGRSGFSGEHLDHGLGKILKAIEEGAIKSGDYILVEAVDRIGRLEPTDMLEIIQKIIKHKVSIVTLEDERLYSYESLNQNQGSLFILIGKIQQANEYSKNLSRRVRSAYKQKRDYARSGILPKKLISPFWIDSNLKIDEVKGDAVRACIDLYLKGYGTRQILIELIPKYNVLEGTHPRTLTRWLKSMSLIGCWSTKGESIRDIFPPLIDELKFYRVQYELKRRTRNMSPEQSYELSGLCKCELCDKNFYYRRKEYNGSAIIYANCSTYLKRGEPFCSNKKTWPYEVLIDIYRRTMKNYIFNGSYDWCIEQQSKEILALEQKIEQTNKTIERLMQLVEATGDMKEATDRIVIYNKERTHLNYQLELLRAASEERFPILHNEIIGEKRVNLRMGEILNDEVETRITLQKSGYKIILGGNKARVFRGDLLDIECSLIKHSTRFKCYIVEVFSPKWKIENPDMVRFERNESRSFVAINRNGVISSDKNEALLYKKLEKISIANSLNK